MTERLGVDVGEEVAPGHQHVDRSRELIASRRREQRRIISDAHHDASHVSRAHFRTAEKPVDQFEFGQRRHRCRWVSLRGT